MSARNDSVVGTSCPVAVAIATFFIISCGGPERPREIVTAPTTAEPQPEAEAVTPPAASPEPAAAPRPAAPEERDRELVQAIRDAVSVGATATTIALAVGRAPTLNTLDPTDRMALAILDLAPEPDTTDRGAQRWVDATDVAYWLRPVAGRNPRIVGVAWYADAPPVVFFAQILPP